MKAEICLEMAQLSGSMFETQ